MSYERVRLDTYRTPAGGILGHVLRLDTKPRKTITTIQWCRLPDGTEGWAAVAFAEPRPLLNLDLLGARPGASVLVVEGEKAAVAAGRLFPDMVVTTSPGGSKAAAKASWSPLRGRHVTIFPDHDQPGRAYAEEVARLALADGEATRAAATCFDAWLTARGGKGSAEMAAGIRAVWAFLEANGASRFQAVWSDDETEARPVVGRIGFRRKNADGEWEFLAMAEGFREMAKGFDTKALASELVKRGMLLTDSAGKTSVQVKVPGQANGRYYIFPASALTGGEDA